MRRTRDKIDYREFGGAPLLGINGVCIIGHGRSDARAIVNAIRVAEKSVTTNLLSEIESEVKKISRRAEIQSAEGTIEAK